MSLDVFKADAFSMRSLTAAINNMPYVPRRIGELGIFRNFGIPTTTAQIEIKDNVLYLVPAKPRNAPGTQNRDTVRKMVPINCVHLPVEDQLTADEVQNIREFGSENALQSVQSKVNEKLMTIRQSFEATLEHHRVGAVKGIVLDADGTTVLYNLFDIFGVTAQTLVQFDFLDPAPASGAVRKKCSAIIRTIEDALGAIPYQYVHGFVGSQFMDDLTSLPETLTAYDRWNQGEQLRAQVARRTFFYAGILFEEYRGSVGGVDYFGADEARFFPVGAPGLFDCAYGPPNWMGQVNLPGVPFYAKTTVDPKDRWVDIDAQSNPVHYCTRPRTLIQALGRSG